MHKPAFFCYHQAVQNILALSTSGTALMTATVDILRDLHRIHTHLVDVQGQLDRCPKQILSAQTVVKLAENKLDEQKQDLQAQQLACSQVELSLAESEERNNKLETRLKECASNKEYQTVKDEIAAVQQTASNLSDDILQRYDAIDTQQASVNQTQEDIETAKADLDQTEKRVQQLQSTLNVDLQRIQSQLSDSEAELPGEFRTEYERKTNARGEEGLAVVEEHCCGSCFQQITLQMESELKSAKLVQCKGCGAILYTVEG